ncbi:MFS transporter [Actinocatenispora sera]|uniref:MFS transporter n=1 Tax=Actinocatenispora sera TaxID=390989 RepID=UPI0033D057AE
MTQPEPTTSTATALTARRLRQVLIVLCGTEITSWGVLYYAFPVLAPHIHHDTGWPLPALTAGLSISQLVAAALGIPLGRLLDRQGPRAIMTTASVIAAPALAAVAYAPTLGWFLAAWIAVGAAMAGTLYPPAFAALTRWYGPDRVKALTALTLIGGLASTVFAPLTAALADHLSWRGVYLTLAAALAAITIPAHLFGLRLPWPTPPSHDPHQPAPADTSPTRIARSRPFLTLTAVLTLAAFTVYAVVVNQVPLLTARGLTPTLAAWALGLGGLGQVAGRLGYQRLVAHSSVRTRTIAILAAAAATTLLLGLIPGPAALLIAGAILAGTARGVFTLLQATAISDRWGTRHYGRLNGLLSAPTTLAAATAPAAGAALATLLGGYPAVFLTLGALTVLATIAAATTTPTSR